MAPELTIGAHKARIAGDTLIVRWFGTPEMQDLREIHDLFERLLAEHGRVFLINHMHRSGLPTGEARKWLANWFIGNRFAGIVNIGASTSIRVIQSLLMRGVALLHHKPKGLVTVAYCDTEAEALAWIAECRRQHDRPASQKE